MSNERSVVQMDSDSDHTHFAEARIKLYRALYGPERIRITEDGHPRVAKLFIDLGPDSPYTLPWSAEWQQAEDELFGVPTAGSQGLIRRWARRFWCWLKET